MWLFHVVCMLDFFQISFIIDERIRGKGYKRKVTSCSSLPPSPQSIINLVGHLFSFSYCSIIFISCCSIVNIANQLWMFLYLIVLSSFGELNPEKLMASFYPGCLAQAEVTPKWWWSSRLCTICGLILFFSVLCHVRLVSFPLIINETTNLVRPISGYQVGTNSHWEAEPAE